MTTAPTRGQRLRLLVSGGAQLAVSLALAAAALLALLSGRPLETVLNVVATAFAATAFRRTVGRLAPPPTTLVTPVGQLLDELADEGWTVRHRVGWDPLRADLDHVAIPPHGLTAFVIDSSTGGHDRERLEQLADGAAWIAARRRQGALPLVLVDADGVHELASVTRGDVRVPILAAAEQHVSYGAE